MIGEIELLAALVTFCVVTLFTPGPNNIMLMTTGLNFGLRRGLPHLYSAVQPTALHRNSSILAALVRQRFEIPFEPPKKSGCRRRGTPKVTGRTQR